MKTTMTTPRVAFKPFDYPQMEQIWNQQWVSQWYYKKIPMQKDISDFHQLEGHEKYIVEYVLKIFSQVECSVGTYWSSLIPKMFPKPEIMMVGKLFGAVEDHHAQAYNYLNELFGLTDFEAFLEDELAMNKLEQMINIQDKFDNGETTIEDIALSLLLFSGAAEGTMLFASFIILMSFKQRGLLVGTSQQMVYSVRDESLHSNTGILLFNMLCDENPGLRESIEEKAFEGFKEAIDHEYAFIDQVFSQGILEWDGDKLDAEDVKQFVAYRAAQKLEQAGYTTTHDLYEQATIDRLDWFFKETQEKETDFFFTQVTNYSLADEAFYQNPFALIDKTK